MFPYEFSKQISNCIFVSVMKNVGGRGLLVISHPHICVHL